ncbi:40193_t:CDS:1, partial [Gigaspora margarita]
IAHAIKRYIRIGCDLTEGTNIEEAIENLSGTSVACIEPNRNQNDIEPNSELL